jgi:MFS family permease
MQTPQQHKPDTSLARLSAGSFPVFSIPGYRRLWLNLLCFWGAMSLSGIANGWLMVDLTDSPLWVGIMAGVGGATSVVFGLFTGALADRFNRRNLLVLGQMCNGLIALGLGLLVLLDMINVGLLLGAVSLQSISGVIQTPARNTLVADLVPRERLVSANAANFMALGIIRIPFAIAGGLLIAYLGIATCYFLMTGVTLVAVAVIAGLKVPPRAAGNAPMLRTMQEGLHYAMRPGPIRSLLLLSVTTEGWGYSHAHMLPVIAKNVLEVGSSGYGYLIAATAAGQLIMNLFLTSRRDIAHKGWLTVGATFGYGLFLVLFALSPWFPLSLLLIFLAGGVGIAYDVGLVSLLQSIVPDAMRGRVLGVYTQTLGANSLGGLQAGAIAGAVGAPFAIGLGATLVMLNALRLAPLARQLNGKPAS